MGTNKKEKNRLTRQGKSGDGLGNVKVKGENFYRSAKRVRHLNLYKDKGAQRNAAGEIVQAAKYQSTEAPVARIEPNRKWFTNTRVISQDTLQAFRGAMAEKAKDPYQVLLRSNKLPMTLIRDGDGVNGLKQHKAKMTVETAPFSETFGPKSQRKRVKLGASNIDELIGEVEKSFDTYADKLEQAQLLKGASGEDDEGVSLAKEPIFNKGGSKRIWNELYKVLDSSDVVIHVLDARDPLGTRCRSVEKYLKTEARHKHLIFVLNKCDLVPTSVAAAWVRTLSKEYPCLAFHASVNNSFGRGSLIALLRQFSLLHLKDRKEISVGLIGYPNVGKSSIINTLKKKMVCTTAPIPGETKVWQYVSLMKRISLIDCPGIVPPNQNDTAEDILLRGVVRIENVQNPEQYIPAVMKKVKTHHMERTYQLGPGWEDDHIVFLTRLAKKSGRLLKGGEPDLDGVAKQVVHDFLRGRIPWFTPCPTSAEAGPTIEGREGKLGEMPLKRKRDDAESAVDAGSAAATANSDGAASSSGDDEFSGFDADGTSDAEEEDTKGDPSLTTDDAEDIISLGSSSDDEPELDSDEEEEEEEEEDDESEAAEVNSVGEDQMEEDEEDAPSRRQPKKKRKT